MTDLGRLLCILFYPLFKETLEFLGHLGDFWGQGDKIFKISSVCPAGVASS